MDLPNLNRLCKWRSIFAGWQLGTRPDTDPECQAVRDHRELSMILRVEVTAISSFLMERGIFTADELTAAIEQEAKHYERDLQQRFPGFRATDLGMAIDERAAKTMKGWKP